MSDREMALRFCAFRDVPLSEYASAPSLDAFLLEYTRRIDAETLGPNLPELESAFETAMRNCAAILGPGAFRRWPPGAARRGPINRAIFESQALALADHDLALLLPRRESISDAFRALFDDPAYDAAVRTSTGDPRRVELRLTKPRSVLSELLQ